MSDPKRLLDSLDPSSPAAAILRGATPPRSMTSGEMSRSAKRIARIAAFPLLSTLLLSSKSVAATALLGAAAGLVVVSAVHVIQSHTETPTIAPHAQNSPDLVAPAQSAAPAMALSIPAPIASHPEAKIGVIPVAPTDTIAQEAALLEQARVQIQSNPAAALLLLQQCARTYRKGSLGMEREFLTVDALHRLGRDAEARRKAAALLHASPDGLYAKQLRQLIDNSASDASLTDDFSKESSPAQQ